MNVKKYKVKVGDLYLHRTFACIDVVSRITTVDTSTGIHLGVLTRKRDLLALKSAGVGYTGDEDLESCEGVIYDFQIIKKCRKEKIK